VGLALVSILFSSNGYANSYDKERRHYTSEYHQILTSPQHNNAEFQFGVEIPIVQSGIVEAMADSPKIPPFIRMNKSKCNISKSDFWVILGITNDQVYAVVEYRRLKEDQWKGSNCEDGTHFLISLPQLRLYTRWKAYKADLEEVQAGRSPITETKDHELGKKIISFRIDWVNSFSHGSSALSGRDNENWIFLGEDSNAHRIDEWDEFTIVGFTSDKNFVFLEWLQTRYNHFPGLLMVREKNLTRYAQESEKQIQINLEIGKMVNKILAGHSEDKDINGITEFSDIQGSVRRVSDKANAKFYDIWHLSEWESVSFVGTISSTIQFRAGINNEDQINLGDKLVLLGNKLGNRTFFIKRSTLVSKYMYDHIYKQPVVTPNTLKGLIVLDVKGRPGHISVEITNGKIKKFSSYERLWKRYRARRITQLINLCNLRNESIGFYGVVDSDLTADQTIVLQEEPESAEKNTVKIFLNDRSLRKEDRKSFHMKYSDLKEMGFDYSKVTKGMVLSNELFEYILSYKCKAHSWWKPIKIS
jgi:hypothetical protein